MTTALLVLVLVVVVAAVIWWLRPPEIELDEAGIELDEATYRAAAELHAIRRRLDLASFKTRLKTDADEVRRQLRDELGGNDD